MRHSGKLGFSADKNGKNSRYARPKVGVFTLVMHGDRQEQNIEG